ncbi:MAG TPA: hypothetical protein DCE42_01185, partial [Myxococcales bacterium]|nr:hypothetical protein [Myxococcales bacterium]
SLQVFGIRLTFQEAFSCHLLSIYQIHVWCCPLCSFTWTVVTGAVVPKSTKYATYKRMLFSLEIPFVRKWLGEGCGRFL